MLDDCGSAGVPKSRSHHVITAHRPAVRYEHPGETMLLAVIAYPVDLRVRGHDHPSAHADVSMPE